MKRILLTLIFILTLFSISNAQPSGPTSTIRFGSADPSTCQPAGANIFYRSDTGTLKTCTATNTWSSIGGASGITIGTTVITSGTATRLLYETSGNVVGEISGLTSNGSTTLVQTSNSATAFESGPNGSTNPVFRLVNNIASSSSGISITGRAAGIAPTIASIIRTQTASSIAGNGLSILADDAVAGSSNAGSAAGGKLTLQAGTAKQLTSGNAQGGDIDAILGSGVGTGSAQSIGGLFKVKRDDGTVLMAIGEANIALTGFATTDFLLALPGGSTGNGLKIGFGQSHPGYIYNANATGLVIGWFSTDSFEVDNLGINLGSTGIFSWTTGAVASSIRDIGYGRNAAGVVEINDGGTLGNYRDIKLRQIFIDQTITTGGTTGNQTINKAMGTVNIAAGNSTITVTSSRCTTSSTVFCSIRTNDTTASIKNIVPANGSFVVNLTAATTAEISIGFEIKN